MKKPGTRGPVRPPPLFGLLASHFALSLQFWTFSGKVKRLVRIYKQGNRIDDSIGAVNRPLI